MEEKGIYFISMCYNQTIETDDVIAFNKKYFTKEEALNKFKEMYPKAKIIEQYESYVKFLWWTFYNNTPDGYEQDTTCGFRLVENKMKKASDCWIIRRELCREYDGIFL